MSNGVGQTNTLGRNRSQKFFGANNSRLLETLFGYLQLNVRLIKYEEYNDSKNYRI